MKARCLRLLAKFFRRGRILAPVVLLCSNVTSAAPSKPQNDSIPARVAAVRRVLHVTVQNPTSSPNPLLTEWLNWPNWGDWNNWNNWANWANWNNWPNWFNM